ncbi:uncharacterized protein LOC118412216 [Branchiostoma floridae]|uniref:Uncharacterized protein LOC118412216 n=1 Tax=Branchiostoma floridae TaxID=7739 RepID=A0A9J7KVJ2_BRAFL|nr:uncharacterized protein LOC118412216 [Branchiostoma floridae]XP_035670830.1 uncharacterized protein LOC118412216 [Branchiostoma floridae]
MTMTTDTSDPRILLDLNRDILVRDIYCVDPIVDHLMIHLTEEEKNTIRGGQGDNRHSQARKLLDVVRSKGLGAFFCFREALRRCNCNYPHLEDLLRHCPINAHNEKFMFWCEQCECLQCEHCKNKHVHPEHDLTAIFSVTENIKTKFDCFVRESRTKLSCIRNRQISSVEHRELKSWAETSGVEIRTLVSKTIEEEENWFANKLSNEGTPSVCEQGSVDTAVLNVGGPSDVDRAAVGQVAARRKYEDAGGLRTLLALNRKELIQEMQFIGPITDSLCKKDVITPEEECIIVQTPSTPQEQARRLLDIIACKGKIETLHHFAKALETTYPYLAELLHQCPEHNAKFEFYCEKCAVLVCLACRDSNHTDHVTTSITTVITLCKSEFDRFIVDNRNKLMDIRHQKIGPDGQVKLVKESGAVLRDMVIRKIDEEVNMFISKLDQSLPNLTKPPKGMERKSRKRKKAR